MTFSTYLKSSRANLGLTQTALAEKLKVPYETYRRWELGGRTPQSRIQTQIKAEIEELLSAVPKHL